MTLFAIAAATSAVACGGNVSVGTGGAGATTTSSHAGPGATGTGTTTSAATTSVASATSSGATTSTGSAASSTSSGGCTGCGMPGFACCAGACVNIWNDIDHCGSCTNKCAGTSPYCHMGTCGTPPCSGTTCTGAETCCGTSCCSAGELCCDVYGPVSTLLPQCTAPVAGTCPVGCTACQCASPETPIATPFGDRPIAELREGDLVYSVDHDAIVAVPIARTQRVPVRAHHVVRVRLATGVVLEVSALHPLADGRNFGELAAGQRLDQTEVVSAEVVPYLHPFTYDIQPASDTQSYFAGGALIGTTIR